MAARRKKTNAAELAGHEDPRTPLDGGALLAAAKPLLAELAEDLLKRADESVAVTAALKERHAAEQKAERTAEGYPEWRRSFVEQVAAAWLLSCVFVRTLEDRGLLGKNRIAGVGAEDSWKAFLQLAPSLSEREYLLTVFRELSRLPAAAELFDARHNPVWLLGPSAEGARKLLELFRSPTAPAPAFRFGGEDTRFLGDLYQDVSEGVRKQYALLQTPRFVERFILDRTLDPAIERFGLNDTTLIDPTCGSGHFLLGAFERLFDARLRAEPGLLPREAATKALDAIAGADINPYAIAIARFRLTLAFVEKCGIRKLKDAPRLPLHLAVADSLLYNPQAGQQIALVAGTDAAAWEEALFSLEDPAAARNVLFKQYAAVVGNPPYITVKDAVLRERYRALYPRSAAGKYSLAAPFAERFFQLGRDGAYVGMITANSFMKREFGKRLIEEYLPTVNLELVVNTAGVPVPGHGTPTVLLFGTRETAKRPEVLAVLSSRGDICAPEDAENGIVWSSIAAHWNDVGFENEYISVVRMKREGLAKHPVPLGGGGALELKELLEERAEKRLAEIADSIGIASFTLEDDVFLQPEGAWLRAGVESRRLRPMVIGEVIRDWSVGDALTAFFPYDESFVPVASTDPALRALWPYRTNLANNKLFGGKTKVEGGLQWFEYGRLTVDKLRTPLTITFAFVATHNHFVLDRGGKVFNRSAPIIKLPETATEKDHLALLAYLNSSTACFWMKQVFFDKGNRGEGGGLTAESWEKFYEFDATKLLQLPLPGTQSKARLAALGAQLDLLGRKRSRLIDLSALFSQATDGEPLQTALEERVREIVAIEEQVRAVQEDLDWAVYEAFGLAQTGAATADRGRGQAGHRASDVVFARAVCAGATGRRYFELCRLPSPETLLAGEPERDPSIAARLAEIDRDQSLRIIETPVYKRTFREGFRPADVGGAAREWIGGELEGLLVGKSSTSSVGRVAADVSGDSRIRAAAAIAGGPGVLDQTVHDELRGASIPYLAALRFTETGMEQHREWERVWELQRAEDRGEKVQISPPGRYGRDHYLSPAFWSLRGKLDVPTERFISYPGCESDEDHEPVYGWAGWDHLQRAVALAGLYQDRKQREGWAKERLMPMLAGLLELLPWLKQWHNEPSADLGGERPSDQFEAFVGAECAEYGWTHEDLRAWRPQARKRGKRAADKEMVES